MGFGVMGVLCLLNFFGIRRNTLFLEIYTALHQLLKGAVGADVIIGPLVVRVGHRQANNACRAAVIEFAAADTLFKPRIAFRFATIN